MSLSLIITLGASIFYFLLAPKKKLMENEEKLLANRYMQLGLLMIGMIIFVFGVSMLRIDENPVVVTVFAAIAVTTVILSIKCIRILMRVMNIPEMILNFLVASLYIIVATGAVCEALLEIGIISGFNRRLPDKIGYTLVGVLVVLCIGWFLNERRRKRSNDGM